MTYVSQFINSLTGREDLPEGPRRQYKFANGFGASVIQHVRDEHRGKWEVCLLQFDRDGCKPMTTLLGDPTTAQVFYFDTAELVTQQMEILESSQGPTGINVIVATPNRDNNRYAD